MKNLNFIDVSGLGNSGKTALVDFLREFDSIYAPEFSFEFDLFRLPNGIIDLHHHLVEEWTLIKSDNAVKKFKELISLMAGSQRRKSLSAYFFSIGTGYEIRFNKKFKKYANEYIESLVDHKYLTFWPYQMINDSPLIRAYKKLLIRFNFKKALLNEIHLTNGCGFNEKTTKFINAIYSESIDKKFHTVVFNNCFEPFFPEKSLNILKNSKCIIVTRDPRDVYVSGLNSYKIKKEDKHLSAFDNNGISKSFLGTDDLEIFISRQSLFYENLYKGSHPNVLIVKFEDLVLSYENTTQKIIQFLELDKNNHLYAKKFFNPEVSKKGIGAWKQYSNQDEIRYIEKNLKKYLIHNA